MTVTGPNLVVFDRKLLEERAYWVKKLSGLDGKSGLRLDHSRSAGCAYAVDVVEIDLDGELYRKLSELTGNGSFLMYTTLMAALKICLHKYTGSRTIVVGSPARKAESPANLLA